MKEQDGQLRLRLPSCCRMDGRGILNVGPFEGRRGAREARGERARRSVEVEIEVALLLLLKDDSQ